MCEADFQPSCAQYYHLNVATLDGIGTLEVALCFHIKKSQPSARPVGMGGRRLASLRATAASAAGALGGAPSIARRAAPLSANDRATLLGEATFGPAPDLAGPLPNTAEPTPPRRPDLSAIAGMDTTLGNVALCTASIASVPSGLCVILAETPVQPIVQRAWLSCNGTRCRGIHDRSSNVADTTTILAQRAIGSNCRLCWLQISLPSPARRRALGTGWRRSACGGTSSCTSHSNSLISPCAHACGLHSCRAVGKADGSTFHQQ